MTTSLVLSTAFRNFADPSISQIRNPPYVVAGDNAVDQIGERLIDITGSPGGVLLVVDHALARHESAARVVRSLEKHGCTIDLFDEVRAEPDMALAAALSSTIRSKAYRAVVGLGGGSAMDPAKLAAMLATNDGAVETYAAGTRFEHPGLPLILVPTTAGTGAEASKNSILSHENRKMVISDPRLVCSLAVLDPTVALSAPPPVTASSGLDALCHAVETYISSSASAFTAANSLAAAEIISKWLPLSYADGSDLAARRAMLYGAHLAGVALNAGTLLGHTMAYTIATRTHLPHGVTAGMSLPYCLAYNGPAIADRLEDLARVLQTDNVVLWAADICKRLSIPCSLEEADLTRQDIPGMVQECMTRYPRPNNPVPFDAALLRRLYEYFLVGDVDSALSGLAGARG